MQLDLAGKSALVTGAASGIGRACARALAEEGARVGLIDVDAAGLSAAETEVSALGGSGAAAVSATADLADERAASAAIDAIADRNAGVDIVVGCAGISGPVGSAVEEVSAADVNAVLAVNITGQFVLAKHGLRHLRQSAAPSVVFIASDSAFVAAPAMAPYCASKAAVVQLTRALSVDFAVEGVRCNCVCPSVVDTPMARADLGADLDPGGPVGAGLPVQSDGDVASHVLYLASPRSRPINGHAMVSDFGYSARSAFPA